MCRCGLHAVGSVETRITARAAGPELVSLRGDDRLALSARPRHLGPRTDVCHETAESPPSHPGDTVARARAA